MKDTLIIGGSNIDIKATSRDTLILHDSNIGTLSVSYGGVSRNVVENLLRISDDVLFLTAVGKDDNGKGLVRQLEGLGCRVLSLRDDKETSHYIAIHDEKGDLYVAICVSDILETLTKEHFRPFEDIIREHESIVIDTNLSKEAIDYLLDTFAGNKFLVEGVSANKIVRLKDHLDHVWLLKSNLLEARYLLGEETLPAEKVGKELFERGVRNAVITDSEHSVMVMEEGKVSFIPVKKAKHVVSTMGCGDSLFAGLIHGLHHGYSLTDAVKFGIRMSEITILSPYAVDPDIGSKIHNTKS